MTRGICEKDLSRRPEEPKWKSYCSNAGELGDLLYKTEGPPSRLKPFLM
jgi:hypothetical protein